MKPKVLKVRINEEFHQPLQDASAISGKSVAYEVQRCLRGAFPHANDQTIKPRAKRKLKGGVK